MNKIRYGIDAPLVPLLWFLGGLGVLIGVAVSHDYATWPISLIFGVVLLIGSGLFLHTSVRGKFLIWQKIIAQLSLPDTSHVLDLGTGHGAVLIPLAQKLTADGQAIGVDLWRNRDQSSNSLAATEANLKLAGVADRTKLITADMRHLTLEDNQFDLVVSSFAFHNIKPAADRITALHEAVRVLKPGGQLIIVDTGHNLKEYAAALHDLKNITTKSCGLNGWWSGPWMGSYMISGEK
ncbi:class I SAM-dependent methyltransferase [Furfurilactobacillus entadae]|uniref:class I SAM-dependent methyltransferase n=1 Tax=Furfurilactobacillus entadae TaxID=2922307 RepID=UPI0035ED0F12